ncbi:MAG: hypothetical protein QOD53_1952 [Thermoleophilaceae bacterium]|nr:hypothetical protein [Thermoleophilaceae bacterium]
MHSAIAFGKRRRGVLAFAVATRTGFWGWRSRRSFPSASLLKPMLLTAYLRRPSVRRRRLRHAERALLEPMIRRSSDAAAGAVLSIVGTGGLRALARKAGIRRFVPVAGVWGESRVDARDQARFFLRIDHFLPRRHRHYGMRLLHSIVPSQRWGIAQVQPRHWHLYFKGGWGHGNGWVDHQAALLTRGHRRVGLAIMTHLDGSHAYGKATLRGLAKRLLGGLSRARVVR